MELEACIQEKSILPNSLHTNIRCMRKYKKDTGLLGSRENTVEFNIAQVAALMGDSSRALMLNALLGGKALTATELATYADISAQTASTHLNKLVEGQLIQVRKQGRHKYFQLKSYQVAEVIEGMLNLNAQLTSVHSNKHEIKTGPNDKDLRHSRICYDHLAGEIAVQLYQALLIKGWLLEDNLQLSLTESGRLAFASFGFNLAECESNKRPMCKPCLDWSERRSHLAGMLGKWILEDALAHQWASRDLDSRAIRFSQSGLKKLSLRYGLTLS